MNKYDPKVNPEHGDFPENGIAKMYSSSKLFGKNDSLVINHHGVCYTLRITQLGKLILTK